MIRRWLASISPLLWFFDPCETTHIVGGKKKGDRCEGRDVQFPFLAKYHRVLVMSVSEAYRVRYLMCGPQDVSVYALATQATITRQKADRYIGRDSESDI